jgi:FAD/FMN-containing dehydrogenase
MSEPAMATKEPWAALEAALGGEGVLRDSEACDWYAQDVYSRGEPAAAVLRPLGTEALQAAVRLSTAAGFAVIPRGGGMSYTSGYVPAGPGSIIIDLGRMNRVLEVNREDMTVTVECGCTWASLHEALEAEGLRTPYWGTLSGLKATVGGGLSQNAIFWGSGQFGSAADSVLSLDVVLADGSLLRTGSAAQAAASPFFRHFGPDLTGLFTGDTGALGFKATATLRLMPVLPARDYLAFDFASAEATIAAMSELSRQNLPMECFAFDPFLQRQRMKRQRLAADMKALAGVMKSAGSVVGGLREGARVALAGRGYMDDVDYSVQLVFEDRTPEAVADRVRAARLVCERHGGREIENSIPRITRANPFGPLNSMLGPEGERWLPVHGLFPHSRIMAAYEAVEALFERHRERSDALGVGTGYLLATVSTHAVVLEPVFFWPDELYPLHEDSIEPKHLARLPRHPANPEARAHVAALRAELVALLSSLGAVHLQVGKAYRYRDGLRPEAFELVAALKRAVDPEGRVNPGSLGLP